MKIAQVRIFGSVILGDTEKKINKFLQKNAEIVKVNSFTPLDAELTFLIMVSFEIDQENLKQLTEVK